MLSHGKGHVFSSSPARHRTALGTYFPPAVTNRTNARMHGTAPKKDPMSAAPNPQDLTAMTAPSPGRLEYGIAIAVLVLSSVTLALLGPFARLPLARVDAFIPAYESALAITDLITAAMLFAHFTRARTLAMLVLPCGYLFNALIIVPHALTFPGVFGPQGVLGGNSQTTAWLYCFWHGGFALYVVAYAMIARHSRERSFTVQHYRVALAVGVGVTALLVLLLTTITIFAPESLTPVIIDGDYSMLVTKGVSPAICIFSIIALVLLWSIRNDSTLNLWLLVVICAWLCNVALSAVVGSSRFDLGWYAGRAFELLAVSVLLIVWLSELSELHEGLARGKLHRATALFEAVIKMTPDLVFVKDLQSKALLRNPAALFGKSWDDIVGRKEAEWHQNPREAEEVVANDRKVIETGKSMQFVERFTTEQGVRTLLSTKSPLFDEQGTIVGTIGVSTDITEREIRAKHAEFIMHELSHRSKNILTIVQALAHQSIRRSSSLEEFSRHFNERLASLARLHDLLIQEEWRGVPLRTIAEMQVGPFAGG
jgi:PAS domain S-box-containing protein